jgi:hypothetical protein
MNPGLKENDIDDNDGADDLNTNDEETPEEESKNGPELDITSETPIKDGNRDGTDLENFANEMDPDEYDDESDENGMNRPPVDDEHENDVNYHNDPVENPPQFNEESVQNEEESSDEEYEEDDDDQLMDGVGMMYNDEENENEDGENEGNMEDVEDYADEHEEEFADDNEEDFVDEANNESAEGILTESEEPQNTVPLAHDDYDEDATEEDEDIAEDIDNVDEDLANRGAKGRRTLLADIPEAEFSEETVNGDYTLGNYPDYSAHAHAAAASSYDYEDNYDYLR